jgi:universal protein Kae1
MLCLGIESTAHTFGVGVMENEKVLANVRDTYIPPEGWGIEPMKAAQHHKDLWKDVLQKALDEAGVKQDDVDVISFSQGPGLPPCLHVGLNVAKKLAEDSGASLVGVNHCLAHIEIGKLFSRLNDPITLYVSGANTQVIAFVSGRYRVFGETSDIGIGNALDKLGRGLGLGFPAGPKIEQEAKQGSYVELPYVVKGMDLSFSGMLTDSLNKAKKGTKLSDVCFSFQETGFAMLTEVSERALAHTGKNEVLLTGGVAANKRLQGMLETMARERGAKFSVCPMEYAGDNGLMIAWLGLLQYRAKCNILKPEKANIQPRQRTDEIDCLFSAS